MVERSELKRGSRTLGLAVVRVVEHPGAFILRERQEKVRQDPVREPIREVIATQTAKMVVQLKASHHFNRIEI